MSKVWWRRVLFVVSAMRCCVFARATFNRWSIWVRSWNVVSRVDYVVVPGTYSGIVGGGRTYRA